MCGISGIVSWDNKNYSQIVKKMSDNISHRGPDHFGIKQLDGACFGHRRLSIIDLSETANQPMFDISNRYCIVYNGEIYGFDSIKYELLRLGHKFNSSSDTEVILEGFKEWGIHKLCERLNGMFAFAIWDNLKKEIYFARDRFGEKPLYFLKHKNSILFSSNANTLYLDKRIEKKINNYAIISFLNKGYCSSPNHIFENLKSVKPGSYIKFSDCENFESNTYWEANFNIKHKYSVNEWIYKLECALSNVIKQELVSDVKVGCLLSGGVDSSIIASHITKIRPDTDLFTIKMKGSIYDESKIASQVANHIGGRHHIIDSNPISLNEFHKLNSQFSEPLGDSSSIAMWIACKEAKKHVDVILTGDGGDEIFAGYNSIELHSHKTIRNLYNFFTNKKLNSIIYESIKFKSNPILRKLATFIDFTQKSTKEFHCNHTLIPRNIDILGHQIKESIIGIDKSELFYRSWNETKSTNLLDKVMEYDLKTSLLDDYLPKVDISSMYHSLEARSPFLHPQIADLLFSMPVGIKRLNNEQKGIAKKLLEINLSNKKVSKKVNRGKRGFVLPIDKWLDNEWSDLIKELPNSVLVQNGLISKNGVNDVITGYKKYPSYYSRLRYSLVSLNSWSKENL